MIKITNIKCFRCNHKWIARSSEKSSQTFHKLQKIPAGFSRKTIIKVCPKCKSPYWNVPRRVKKRNPINSVVGWV